MSSNPVNRLEQAWSHPAPSARETLTSWKEKVGGWDEDVKDFIVEHPTLAVVAAAMVGLVVGWMVKRK